MSKKIPVYRDEHSAWADEYVCEHADRDEKSFSDGEQYGDVVLCTACADMARAGAEIVRREPVEGEKDLSIN